jgi:hypothetical protein
MKINWGMLGAIKFKIYAFHLLSNNIEIKIQKSIILQLVFYRYESWSLTFSYEHQPPVFLSY